MSAMLSTSSTTPIAAIQAGIELLTSTQKTYLMSRYEVSLSEAFRLLPS